MKKHQRDQYNMINLVEHHFDNHTSIWSSNVLISGVKAALSAKIKEINAARSLQSEDSTGATMDKATLRGRLEKKGFFVSSALKAYVGLNPDHEQLSKKVLINKSSFYLFREDELLVAAENLNAAATAIIEALAPYGVTQTTLTELMEARTDFLNIMNVPEEVTTIRKNATEAVAVLLHEAVALLEGQMDHLMEVFSDTEPSFYNVYFKERKIHRSGSRKMSLVITTLNAATKIPLAQAQIEVADHHIKRKSSKTGLNRVQNLKEGYYILTVSHPDFVSKTIPFSIVNHQTTELVVEMEEVAKSQRFKGSEELSDLET